MFDENGGIWDRPAPLKADRWGPGTRIPAIVIAPFAKRGFVDHSPNDTASILPLITGRFDPSVLKGAGRDAAVAAHDEPPLGDLASALNFIQK